MLAQRSTTAKGDGFSLCEKPIFSKKKKLSGASTSTIPREERIKTAWIPVPRKSGSYQSSKKSHGVQYHNNARCGGFCFCGNSFLVILLPKWREFISLTTTIPERQENEFGKVSYFNLLIKSSANHIYCLELHCSYGNSCYRVIKLPLIDCTVAHPCQGCWMLLPGTK